MPGATLILGSTAGEAVLIAVGLTIAVVLPIYFAGKNTVTKGRGWPLGIILGFFLGWIGVLISALLRPR